MAVKGSKYARKHLKKIQEKTKPDIEDTFLDVVYDDITYLDTFDALSLDNQIKAYKILKGLSEMERKTPEEKVLAAVSLHKMTQINMRAGLEVAQYPHYAMSSDELHVIRMDCYGCVDARRPHLLSPYYNHFFKNKLSKPLSPESYDLDKAPSWKIFRQFDSFRNIEDKLKEYTARQRLNPEMLKVISVQDFSEIIFNAFKKNTKDKKAIFAPSKRNQFVKDIVREKGNELAAIMQSQGVDERYINSLLNAMKHFGITDASRVIVTEPYFTKRVLTDLKRAKIPCDEYHIGDPVPQALVDELVYADKGYLLAAREKNGALLDKTNFPSFEVHHKVAVSESSRLGYISRVNYRRNFLLVSSKLHTEVLHAFDKLSKTQSAETYQRRLEFIDPGAAFMYGFKPENQILLSWQDTPEDKKIQEEDEKYIVSYDEVMRELQDNRTPNNKANEQSIDVKILIDYIRNKHGFKRG